MADSLELWRRGGAAFAYGGHEIFVRRGGEPAAPVVLLIHGFPTASWDFAPLWDGLAARGLGGQADLVQAFLRAEGVAEYHVLAHDYGDTVAQELLARDAAVPALRSVCLLNGGIFPEAHRPLPIQRLLSSPVGPLVARLSSRATFATSMRRIFGPARPPTPAERDGWWALITQADGRAALASLSRYRQERRQRRARWVGALRATRVPLRLIVGTADPIAGAGMAARYRQLVPRPDVVELAGVGHYPQVEAPGLVLEAYGDFRAAHGVG